LAPNSEVIRIEMSLFFSQCCSMGSDFSLALMLLIAD
jgi:hypothetical protein